MKKAEIEKTDYFQRQYLAIELSEYCKIKALSSLNFSGKIRLLFALFWLLFAKKWAWSKVKGSQSKFDIAYFTNTIPGHVPLQNVLLHHFPVLWL